MSYSAIYCGEDKCSVMRCHSSSAIWTREKYCPLQTLCYYIYTEGRGEGGRGGGEGGGGDLDGNGEEEKEGERT